MKEIRRWSFNIRVLVFSNLESHHLYIHICACMEERMQGESGPCKTEKLHVEVSCIEEQNLQAYYYFR